MELLKQLGIDWRLLIAQLINFLILLAILYKFAYKPLLKLLNERSIKIEKSLEDAKKIEENLAASQNERHRIISEGERSALKIREQAIAKAEKQSEELLERTRRQAEEIIKQAKQQIEGQKQEMIREARVEISDIVIEASKKVLSDVASDEINRKLTERTVIEFT